MVAGGGGGAAYNGVGGYGGGLISSETTYSIGGTQISGYSFGLGQPGTFVDANVDVAGGGGGYYGGHANSSGIASTYQASGAGGSSFISGYAGVNAIEEGSTSNPRNHTDNTKHYSGKYFVDAVMIPGNQSMPRPDGGTEIGHSGNGYARITFLGSSEPARTNTKLNNVRYIKDCINRSDDSVNNLWVEIQGIDTLGINRAQGKTGKLYNANGTEVTTASNANRVFDFATDGLISNVTSSSGYAMGSTSTGYQCFIVDISDINNDTYDLNEIGIWHYYLDGRTYYSNTTYVSSDGTNWFTVISSEEPETSEGKRTSAFKNVDMSEYVTDDLLLHYDGIYNTPTGHSNNTTTWCDLSGNEKNATLSNFGTSLTSGWRSNSLAFDGSNDYALFSSSATFPATYSFVVKTSSIANNMIVFGDYSSTAAFGFYNNGFAIVGTTSRYTYNITPYLNVNMLNHISIVYISNATYLLYINGNLISETSNTNNWSWNDTNSYIGKRSTGTYFNGNLYNFMIYNRALTAQEISTNYNVDKNRFGL